MKELINIIELKHCDTGIKLNPAASIEKIEKTEVLLGFKLPEDFKEFYQVCNGFECQEDIFNFLPLEDLLREGDHGKDWAAFAEYMIHSDVWSLRVLEKGYEIFYNDGHEIVLTNALTTFLERFLKGNVFDEEGLYEWRDEIKKSQQLL
ncbi:MAG: SMI1/KNR4 family protein [Chitinophagaceae bacterium]